MILVELKPDFPQGNQCHRSEHPGLFEDSAQHIPIHVKSINKLFGSSHY